MNKKSKTILWITILLLIFGLSAGTLLLPKKDYSEQENRYLESFPKFTLENVLDGSFMQDLETYLSDHFVFRNAFMTLRTRFERLLGKNQINGIYLCEDDFYIEEYAKPLNTKRIISAVERLETKLLTADLTVMIVPTAVTVYADKLPATAKNASQTEELQTIYAAAEKTAKKVLSDPDISRSIHLLDVTDALLSAAATEPLYYKLDHHWTTAGAFVAYQEYCKINGITPSDRASFTETVVTDDFRGTVYSKLNDTTAGADRITAFQQDNLSLTVQYEENEPAADSLYAEEYLSMKDKYSYFLDNIHPFIEITNNTTQSDEVLFLVKDSYANCMVPFLINHYKTVYVADTRYYKGSVTEFINSRPEITDVLMLYNLGTIDSDLGIGGIY